MLTSCNRMSTDILAALQHRGKPESLFLLLRKASSLLLLYSHLTCFACQHCNASEILPDLWPQVLLQSKEESLRCWYVLYVSQLLFGCYVAMLRRELVMLVCVVCEPVAF